VSLLQSPYEYVDEARHFEPADSESFDRIAFALRALDWLQPPRVTVALYSRRRELRIETGRDLKSGYGASWAMVGIPPHASRRHIAHALAELAGLEDVPFIVDLVVKAASRYS
jgi:hypothetical protein